MLLKPQERFNSSSINYNDLQSTGSANHLLPCQQAAESLPSYTKNSKFLNSFRKSGLKNKIKLFYHNVFRNEKKSKLASKDKSSSYDHRSINCVIQKPSSLKKLFTTRDLGKEHPNQRFHYNPLPQSSPLLDGPDSVFDNSDASSPLLKRIVLTSSTDFGSFVEAEAPSIQQGHNSNPTSDAMLSDKSVSSTACDTIGNVSPYHHFMRLLYDSERGELKDQMMFSALAYIAVLNLAEVTTYTSEANKPIADTKKIEIIEYFSRPSCHVSTSKKSKAGPFTSKFQNAMNKLKTAAAAACDKIADSVFLMNCR